MFNGLELLEPRVQDLIDAVKFGLSCAPHLVETRIHVGSQIIDARIHLGVQVIDAGT